MADEVDRQALLTTLTTEHFALQGARGSTIAESSARAAMYLGSLSASLVSLGFLAQISATGDTFRVFALVVLPTVFALGIFTFVRLVESTGAGRRGAAAALASPQWTGLKTVPLG